MGVFCLLVELYREWSAPAACAAGLFCYIRYILLKKIVTNNHKTLTLKQQTNKYDYMMHLTFRGIALTHYVCD